MKINWAAIGAGCLALAVIMGAFGAHGLRSRLDAYAMGVYERAVFYHFIHAMGLLMIPLFMRSGLLSPAAANRVAWLMMIGILLFSGSLYALAISGVGTLGAVTPFGGVAFILAWILLGYGFFRNQR